MDLRDKKTNIKFYNGMKTIGGTYIEVSYGDSRIIFDFGSEFNPNLEKEPESLEDILDEGLVPYVDGVFDSSIKLEKYPKDEKSYKNTAVFLSHVHLDHSKMINYLDEKIDLYTTEKTKNLLEVLNINEDFLYKNKNLLDRKVRKIKSLSKDEKISIGEISVTMLPVDHDAYGASALIIDTPDKKIAYTGDIRMHGFRQSDTLDFCKEAKLCDVLIMEGVSVSFKDFGDPLSDTECANEQNLIEEITQIIKDNPEKQITFNYYISNIERIIKLKEICPRQVVVSDYNAFVIYKLTKKKFNYYKTSTDLDYGLDESLEISLDELVKDKSRYFWQFSKALHTKIDLLAKDSIYIHTDAEPLGEFDPKYLPFLEMFKKRDIVFIRLTCSGHAFPKDLIKIIDEIKPKLLVPIHSQKPEKLYNNSGDRLLPERNQMI